VGLNVWTLLLRAALVLTAGSLSLSCGTSMFPEPSTTQLASTPSPMTETGQSTRVPTPAGQVYAAQIRGQLAPGYPYPVFFLDLPSGAATLTLSEVTYGSSPPLNEVHPRLERVIQEVTWPDGSISQVAAQDFYYDETACLLLSYVATLDGVPLDTVSYDVFTTPGVGIAFLGDTGGVNVFYNYGATTTIDYQELATDDHGHPTEASFRWQSDADAYHVHVQMSWGVSDPSYGIAVITGLTAAITRG
jgi:hypothetical protein